MDKEIKILIAEDEKPLAGAMDLKLKKEGFKTEVAYNGREAMDILQKDKIDLVILDLVMPKLDGFGVLSEAKEKGIKTPIIVVSNLVQIGDKTKAKELGAVDFLIKSETPMSRIVEKIKEFLNI
jgi:DNA-binding response OmpR family regulator